MLLNLKSQPHPENGRGTVICIRPTPMDQPHLPQIWIVFRYFTMTPKVSKSLNFLVIPQYTIKQHTSGIYTFSLTKDGYESYVSDHEITTGSNSAIPVSLELTYGSVSFTTSQKG